MGATVLMGTQSSKNRQLVMHKRNKRCVDPNVYAEYFWHATCSRLSTDMPGGCVPLAMAEVNN